VVGLWQSKKPEWWWKLKVNKEGVHGILGLGAKYMRRRGVSYRGVRRRCSYKGRRCKVHSIEREGGVTRYGCGEGGRERYGSEEIER